MPLASERHLDSSALGRWFPRPEPRQRKPNQRKGKLIPPLTVELFLKKHCFLIHIVPGILKKSIFVRNPYDVLESRLLALSTNIAVDSPKHCKGCKNKTWISGCLGPYRFFFGGFCNPYSVLEGCVRSRKLTFWVFRQLQFQILEFKWRQLHTFTGPFCYPLI